MFVRISGGTAFRSPDGGYGGKGGFLRKWVAGILVAGFLLQPAFLLANVDDDALQARADVVQAKSLSDSKQFQDAHDMALKATHLDRKNPLAWLLLGGIDFIDLDSKDYYEEAEGAFKQYLKLRPRAENRDKIHMYIAEIKRKIEEAKTADMLAQKQNLQNQMDVLNGQLNNVAVPWIFGITGLVVGAGFMIGGLQTTSAADSAVQSGDYDVVPWCLLWGVLWTVVALCQTSANNQLENQIKDLQTQLDQMGRLDIEIAPLAFGAGRTPGIGIVGRF